MYNDTSDFFAPTESDSFYYLIALRLNWVSSFADSLHCKLSQFWSKLGLRQRLEGICWRIKEILMYLVIECSLFFQMIY